MMFISSRWNGRDPKNNIQISKAEGSNGSAFIPLKSTSGKIGRGKRVGGNPTDSEKDHNIMIKEGDRFKDKKTGKVYIVKNVYRGEVLLQGENGLGRRFTNLNNLKVTCDKLEDKVLKD